MKFQRCNINLKKLNEFFFRKQTYGFLTRDIQMFIILCNCLTVRYTLGKYLLLIYLSCNVGYNILHSTRHLYYDSNNYIIQTYIQLYIHEKYYGF